MAKHGGCEKDLRFESWLNHFLALGSWQITNHRVSVSPSLNGANHSGTQLSELLRGVGEITPQRLS